MTTVAQVDAAALVALLEERPKAREELQAELELGSYRFGRALAKARLAGYVEIPAGVVTLTEKGSEILAAGRARLETR